VSTEETPGEDLDADLPIDSDLPIDPDLAPVTREAQAANVFDEPSRRPPRDWDVLAVIAVGGGLGSLARYGLGQAWPTPAGGFPWATLTINLSGSFLLGVLMVYVIQVWPPHRYARPFLGVGVLGGYTTFSTYAGDIHGLAQRGSWALADAYALTTLVGALAATGAGMVLARWLARTTGHLSQPERPTPTSTGDPRGGRSRR
jgi:CrcB protein